ncbi:hypothetical protein RK92_001315 [Staphylococcus aureus]|nr:hypothetical protein RK92_001315 [Staphylococcus aureus]HAR7165305.1 hypothetical protein [Staphylococcus aureus]
MQVGVGPQHREFRKEILQTMQVGVGPQHREFRKEILQTMQVGVGPNIECDVMSAYYNVQVGLQRLCEIYLMPIFSAKFLYFVKHLAYHESARYFVVLTMHVHFYFGEVSSDV